LRPDLRSLEIFFWVGCLGSFRRAAAKLNTSQPAVSQRIAHLEAQLGVQLLLRGSKKVSFTAEGRALHSFAERSLQLSDELISCFVQSYTFRGELRLGISETIVHTWLPHFIERTNAIYPDVALNIAIDVSKNLSAAVVDGDIDLAFMTGPVNHPTLTEYPLCEFPLALVSAPSDDPMINVDQIFSQNELSKLPIITFPTGSIPHQALRQYLGTAGLHRIKLHSNSSLSSIIRMTLDRIGVSLIPAAVIEDHLMRGELILLKTNMNIPDLSFVAAVSSVPEQPLCKALAQLAQEVAAAWR
jgi:DNA-binding transcriptional LysR family regulator